MDSLTPRPGIRINEDLKTMTAYDIQKDPTDGSSWICLDVMNVQCSIHNKHGIIISRSALNVLRKIYLMFSLFLYYPDVVGRGFRKKLHKHISLL